MERNRRKAISVLPVISSSEGGLFVGLLRLHDLIRAGFSISTPHQRKTSHERSSDCRPLRDRESRSGAADRRRGEWSLQQAGHRLGIQGKLRQSQQKLWRNVPRPRRRRVAGEPGRGARTLWAAGAHRHP